VRNTDPEDERGDVQIPADRIIFPRDANACQYLIQPRAGAPRHTKSEHGDGNVPPLLRLDQRLREVEIGFRI